MSDREGRILRDRRLELGLTQEQVALDLGMSIHQYQRYEYGEHKIANCPCESVCEYAPFWSLTHMSWCLGGITIYKTVARSSSDRVIFLCPEYVCADVDNVRFVWQNECAGISDKTII